jgi:peroxiredoxin
MNRMTIRLCFSTLFLTAATLLARAEFAASAADAKPIAPGRPVPAVVVQTADGAAFDLAATTADRPTLLIFYRGGWCPYCTKHLAQLQEIEPELVKLGYQILAVSPEPAALLAGIAGKHRLTHRLLSDNTGAAAQALGLAFRVDAETQKKYAGYGIPLQPIPGEPDARWLPVPAAILIGSDGVIRFVFTNPDYKTRIDTAQILIEARRAVAE